MGEHLGIPPRIASKPASPQLWPGHTADEELPAGYEKLDLVMHRLFDARGTVPRAAREAGVSRMVVSRVLEMHRKSAHKRALPPSLRPSSAQSLFMRTKD
jgi:NAD+ synthase